jgi:hypothetical protein
LQAFYQAIKDVTEFDEGPIPLSSAIEVVGRGNAQSYIILFGSYRNQTEPPMVKALNLKTLSASTVITYTCQKMVILFSASLTYYVN